MSYSNDEKQEIFEALKQFQNDTSWQDNLSRWTNRFNIFDVLKISNMEIRHSNMLAWLLDSNETHGWGNSFLKIFLHEFQGGCEWLTDDVLLRCNSFIVRREYKDIDLLLVSEQCHSVIAIENKVRSNEHDDQLKKYHRIVCKEYGRGWNKLFIFLTLNGESPSDDKDAQIWESFSHGTILELIERCNLNNESDFQVKFLIEHYIATLRRILMRDDELRAFCDEIYAKHKKAIDFIYENKTDKQLIFMEKIKKIFNKRKSEILFNKENVNKKYIWFHTTAMNSILKPLETDSGSWGKKCIYKYEICSEYNEENNSFHLSAYLVLGGWNVHQTEKSQMDIIVNKYNSADKNKNNFKFKKIKGSGKSLNNIFIDSEDLEKNVNALIDKLLSFEKEVISFLKLEQASVPGHKC